MLVFLFIMLFHQKIKPTIKPTINNWRSQQTVQKILNLSDAEAYDIVSKSYISPNLKNPQGDSILIWAVSRHMPLTTKALLDKGADPNLADQSSITPLMFAAASESAQIVKILLDAGADLTLRDQQKRTALFYAVQNQTAETGKMLILKGADIHITDKQGETPLHQAVRWHSIETIGLLLNNHADLMALNDAGTSPLKLMELSPYYYTYVNNPAVKSHLPKKYFESLPIEDLTDQKRPAWNMQRIQKLVHQKVNEKRREHGLNLYSYDRDLERLALLHSEDMASKGFFAHVNQEGESPSDRALRLKIPTERIEGNLTYRGVGENLFMSSMKQSIAYYIELGVKKQTTHWHTDESIAESIVMGWMNSPGHRKNMLTPRYREEGIGIFITDTLKIYATQEMK